MTSPIKFITIALSAVFLIGFGFDSSGQQCFDPEWDWEKPEEWKIYYPQGVQNYSPFNRNRASSDIRRIIDNDSLKRSEGWVLLYKNLGCEAIPVEQPRVIFYNRYRSILRVMAIHRSGPRASSGLLEVEWGSGATNRSSLLTSSNVFAYSNSAYPERSEDRVVNTIDSYVSSDDAWWVSDFQVAFDHKTNSTQKSAFLIFRSYNIVDSNLSIEGTIDLTSKSIDLKGAKKTGTEGDKQNWAVKGVKAVQSLKPGEWEDYLKKANESLKDISETARENWDKNDVWAGVASTTTLLARATSGEGKLGEVLKSIADVGGVVGSVIGIAADLFGLTGKSANKPSTVQIAPFVTTGTISQTGSIKTQTDEESYTLDLPGIKPTPFTYYTCPLGVLNLREAIKINKRAWTEEQKVVSEYGKESISTGSNYSKTVTPVLFYDTKKTTARPHSNEVIKTENWKSLQLSENIDLAINSASGLKLVDAVVAFQAKVQGTVDAPDYELFEPYVFLPQWYSQYPRKSFVPVKKRIISWICPRCSPQYNYVPGNLDDLWKNKTFDYLKNGTYKMIKGGELLENGKINKLYTFRTGYVDIESAKNMSITVRKNTTVTMKIIAVLQDAYDPDAPLTTFSNEYVIDENNANIFNENKPFSFIRGQLDEVNIADDDQQLIAIKNDSEYEDLYPMKYVRKHKSWDFIGYEKPPATNVLYEDNNKIQNSGNLLIEYENDALQFQSNTMIVLKPGFYARPKNPDLINSSGSFTAKIVNGDKIVNTTSVPRTEVIQYYKDGVPYDTPQQCECVPQGRSSTFKNSAVTLATKILGSLKIYPNPGNNSVTISYPSHSQNGRTVKITNLLGSLVLQTELIGDSMQLDISSLPNGMYMVSLLDNGTLRTKKLIKN